MSLGAGMKTTKADENVHNGPQPTHHLALPPLPRPLYLKKWADWKLFFSFVIQYFSYLPIYMYHSLRYIRNDLQNHGHHAWKEKLDAPDTIA